MDLIDILGRVAPTLALNLLKARRRLEIARLYDAASPSNYRPSRGGAHSGTATMDATGDRLRRLSRHLDENHDLATGILDDLVRNTVADGRVPVPMVRRTDGTLAAATNRQIADRYAAWAERPEVTQQHSMADFEALLARSLFRDGEVFAKSVRAGYPHRTRTRLALEGLEADFCPFYDPQTTANVIHGIETDGWGRPLRYWFYDQHPGDYLSTRPGAGGKLRPHDAGDVLHLKFTRRLHQTRGVPIFHSALNRLRDVHDYEESERIAAKMAAELTGFIKRNSEFAGVVDNDKRVLEMSSGAFFELAVGEDVGTISSDRPNTGLADFRAAMLRAVAAGTGTRYSSIARDYNGTYSAQRQELVEASIGYRMLFKYLVGAFYLPTYRQFLDATPIDFEPAVDPETVTRVEYRAPALPWIDPKKEAEAWVLLSEAKLESKTEIMRQRGRDPAKVLDELLAEADQGVLASTVSSVDPRQPATNDEAA